MTWQTSVHPYIHLSVHPSAPLSRSNPLSLAHANPSPLHDPDLAANFRNLLLPPLPLLLPHASSGPSGRHRLRHGHRRRRGPGGARRRRPVRRAEAQQGVLRRRPQGRLPEAGHEMAFGQMLVLQWHQAHGGGQGEVLGDPGCLFGSQSTFSQAPYSVSVPAMYSISCTARIPSVSTSAASRTSSGTRSRNSGRRTRRYARCGCLRGCVRRPWRSLHMSWRGWTRSSS